MATVTPNTAGSEALRRALAEIASKQARVGFFEHSKYPDGTSVAHVATIQEFHPQHARPFMRPTIEEQRSTWQDTLKKGMQAVINGRIDATAMLQQFGMLAAGDVRLTISRITSPELSPITLLLRKRRNSPDFTPGGRAVGQAARDARFTGPRAADDRNNLSGVSTKPLVDTGLLIQSVNSDVVDR
ncbi:hypothetical protein NRB16_24490 [Pseudomonas sp. LJDD11]|uniref:hypothetical protein n=1 Tax=Pseudomonas sp. LJDD11 TaxID=2931984 RepID=UPI00211CF683|nr:hypothetical protein [Pseudomonas sp. LJDD11]MCQ9426683.1 hypothetical protein [Pseudomonas sp. LJDD11]